MKWAVLLCTLSAVAMATDPAYPTTRLEGYYLAGLDSVYKITLDPGTLEKCVDSPQPTYVYYNCDVKDLEVNVDNGTKKHKFLFTHLSANEMAGGASYPATMTYYFSGLYGTTLPDGTTFETTASLNFTRKLSDPDNLQGNLNVYSLGINAGVTLKWPSVAAGPARSPAP